MACVPHPARKIILCELLMTCRYVGVEASALLSIHAGMGGSLFFYGHVENHMQIYVKEERGADVPRQQV